MENKENKSLSGFWMATADGFSSYKVVVAVVVESTRHDMTRVVVWPRLMSVTSFKRVYVSSRRV